MAATTPKFTEEEITASLLMLVAFAGNASRASAALKSEKGISVNSVTLGKWAKDRHSQRYQEFREKYQEKLEAQLIAEYRDVAMLAVETQRIAIERAREALEAGNDKDPSRTAANLSTVADKSTRDMLSLSGRPTSIREDRNVGEILRSLAAKGVLQLPEPAVDAEPDGPTAD